MANTRMRVLSAQHSADGGKLFEAQVYRLAEREPWAASAQVMELLKPIGNNDAHDDAMIALTLAAERFRDPLSQNEVTVLACMLYQAHLSKTTDYSDVLNLTYQFRKDKGQKSMSTTTVYSVFRNLVDRGFIDDVGRNLDEETQRLSRSFQINDSGKEAFRIAVLNAQRLAA